MNAPRARGRRGRSHRRVTVFVLVVMVVVVGVITTRRLPLELLPAGLQDNDVSVDDPGQRREPGRGPGVDRPADRGAPPDDARDQAPRCRARPPTRPGSTSSSRRDVDLDLATAEVRDRLERARLSWPPEVRRYRICRFNFDTDLPIFQFGIVIQQPSDELTFLIEEKIVKPLEAIPGVARVQCRGLLDDQVRIFVNQNRALAAGVSLYELTRALEAGNVDVSGGEIEEGGVRYTLKSSGRFRSIEEIRDFPIRPGLKLGQIATIEPRKTVRDLHRALAHERRRSGAASRRSRPRTPSRRATACARRSESGSRRIRGSRSSGVSFHFFDWGDIGAVITSALKTLGDDRDRRRLALACSCCSSSSGGCASRS